MSRGEVLVYEALSRALPAGWYAWHSLRLRTAQGYEGEGDFVIGIPEVGVLSIEVKGGRITLEDGLWKQNGRPLKSAPREQAHGYLRLLKDKLRERGIAQPPFMIIATSFPETAFDAPPSNGDLDGTILGQQHLPVLDRELERLAGELRRTGKLPRSPGWEDALHALWGETWIPSVGLGARVAQREAELVALDRDQLAVLDFVDRSERLRVRGGPGTGKTLLAAEICRRWKAAGRSPMLLCYTRALSTTLSSQGLPSHSIRDLAASVVEASGEVIQSGETREAWTNETWRSLPSRAASLWAEHGEPIDAVVVDEAQDLAPEDWQLVQSIAGAGALWAFGDEGQSFLNAAGGVPEGLFTAELGLVARYRCPEALARFADAYRPGFEGEVLRPEQLVVIEAPPEHRATVVGALAQTFLEQGCAPRDVVMLSLAGVSRSEIARADSVGEVPVVRADDARAAEQVIADTFLRFKGLERPYVILTELGAQSERYAARLHIALSRATVSAIVVATPEELAADPRLRGAG
jgi:hypothetical protein